MKLIITIIGILFLLYSCNSQPKDKSHSNKSKAHSEMHEKNHGKAHGEMHGKDHGKTHSEKHGKAHGKIHWGYKGAHGPAIWGKLPGNATCGSGKKQSPIDIKTAIAKVSKELKAIQFNYKPTSLNIVNNGHTIQVNYDKGSTATINGKQYDLLQFHFHSKSENTVNGKPYDMEMHLVHADKDKNLAVVGVFMKKGAESSFIKAIWDNIPKKINVPNKVKTKLNANDFLPSKRSYFSFTGSLTTPPCNEGVSWSVIEAPVEVSEAQIKQFVSLIKPNARPVQPLNDRKVNKL